MSLWVDPLVDQRADVCDRLQGGHQLPGKLFSRPRIVCRLAHRLSDDRKWRWSCVVGQTCPLPGATPSDSFLPFLNCPHLLPCHHQMQATTLQNRSTMSNETTVKITREALVTALNEDLSREYQAIIAYVNYS